jgi:hypothetical protein
MARIFRIEKNSRCKKITSSQPEGSRKKGRPKLMWLDSVLKDVKALTEKQRHGGRKHLIGISGGRSSSRPRSIQDCRAKRRRTLYLLVQKLKLNHTHSKHLLLLSDVYLRPCLITTPVHSS